MVLVDPATGKQLKTLDHQHDDAWLLEPRGLTWMPDGEHVAIRTEETGWDHLVLVAMDGRGGPRPQASGKCVPRRSLRDGKWWTLSTSEAHPSELHLYRMPADGGPRTRIDNLGEGEVTAVWAPGEDGTVLRWSTPKELTDLYLLPSLTAAPIRLTRSGTDMFWKLAWPTSDFVTFNDDQGKPVWARVYRPATQHANRPAVMEIHGAGYAQGVHKAFSGSSAHGGSLYAKHLTDLGVTYMVLDYRASAGYGA